MKYIIEAYNFYGKKLGYITKEGYLNANINLIEESQLNKSFNNALEKNQFIFYFEVFVRK